MSRSIDTAPLDTVLIDFGHTLFAHQPLADTVFAAAQQLGLAMSRTEAAKLATDIDRRAHLPDELARDRDLHDDVWRERFGILYSATDDRWPGLGARIYELMHAPDQWIPYPAAADTLGALANAKTTVVVVSNTGWDIRSVFAHHRMSGLVDHFVLSYEVGAVKPQPAIFRAALEWVNAEATQAIMVGDDPIADVGAQRCGIRTLLLPALPPGQDNGLSVVAKIVGR